MEGAIGVKTGFTGDAGYCFVGAIRRVDRTLVSVVLGCGWPPRKNLKWSDTTELMNYGVENYREKQIFQKAEFNPLIVEDGQKKYEILDIKGDLPLLMREDEVVRVEYLIPDKLKAPVKANQIIGKAQYYINGVLYREIPIYATQDILKIDFPFCIKEILKLWTNQY
jgi:D-alanyl-D-alanine carboxypeptidase (penicillin-binding protein 5/6)